MSASKKAGPIFLFLITFFCLAVPLIANADNTADEAELRFRRGVEFYRNGKYEDALAEFFHSHRLVNNRNVLHNIARCYERLDRFEEAYRYYHDVLHAFPQEEDRASLEESLERIRPEIALLVVKTEPSGADIYIDRKDLGSRGQTPATLALPPGNKSLILSLDGHRDASTEVLLEKGLKKEVDISMDFIMGHVLLKGLPDGALVDSDVEFSAEDEPDMLKMPPGNHYINISAPGYKDARMSVNVIGDDVTELIVGMMELPPSTGTLVIKSNRDGALVRINSRDIGFSPAVLELPTGEHHVQISMPNMSVHEETVIIEEDKRLEIHADLRFTGGRTQAASKNEVPMEKAPASITVITREEIRAFGYSSLPEALMAVRGMFLSNDRSYEYLGIRGFSPPGDLNSRVLILYNGHAVNDIFAGHAYLGRENTFDLEDVERIEIVRGPVSSLFGSGAFLGLVNIVPREPDDSGRAEISGAAGSLGLTRGRGKISHRGEKVNASLSLGILRSEGDEHFLLPGENNLPEVSVRNRDGETVFGGSARLTTESFRLFGYFNSRSKDVPTGVYHTLLDRHSVDIQDQRAFVEALWETQKSRAGYFGARTYYDVTRFNGNFLDEEGKQEDWGRADWAGAEIAYRSREFLRQTLVLGLEYQAQFNIHQQVFFDGQVELDDKRIFHVASAYLVDELRLGKNILFNAGTRVDHYLESFGTTVNPRFALVAGLVPEGITKLMAARSFRAPTPYERFYEDGPIDPGTGERNYRSTKSFPDLEPEIIHSIELEHIQHLGPELSLTGSVYVNRISDLIVLSSDPGEIITYRINSESMVRTEGAEIELRWQPYLNTVFTGAYWYQQMHVGGLNDPAEERRLRSNAPAHAFSLKSYFPISAPIITGAVEAIYNSDRLTRDGNSTGSFLLLNAGLSGEISRRNFNYYAGVRNLLDERVLLPAGEEIPRQTIPGYGRTFLIQAGLKY